MEKKMENSNTLIKSFKSYSRFFLIFIHVQSRDVILKQDHKFMIIFEEFYLKKQAKHINK